jgi:hypothetical protein
MKRFPFPVSCLAFLLLLVLAGIVYADSPNTTITVTTNATTLTATTATATATAITTPDRAGGSIYFDVLPSGATIWLDGNEIGTGGFTYYAENPGTFTVRAWKKGYENYTANVTVDGGRRVVFSADLPAVSGDAAGENTPAAPVETATTIWKSTMKIPTPWPTSTASPVDPAVVIGAAAAGAVLLVIRRR